MLTRIITSAVALAIFIPVLYFSHTHIYTVVIALLAVIAVFEMQRCIGCIKKLPLSISAISITALVVLGTRIVDTTESYVCIVSVLMFAYLVYLLAAAVFSRGKITVEDVCVTFATTVYISASFASMLLIRDMENGKYLYLIAFFAPWVSDIFAYFCGRAFGKHKLIPDVSPKKTVEGAIGGMLFCGLVFIGYCTIVSNAIGAGNRANIIVLFIIGVVLSVVSQIGDLVASLIKRRYSIKDYGKLFPGHGGVMDRFDSVIATTPLLFAICSVPQIIVILG